MKRGWWFWLWVAVKHVGLICLFSLAVTVLIMLTLYGNCWVWYEPNPVIYWAEYVLTVWGVVAGALLIVECVRECTKR